MQTRSSRPDQTPTVRGIAALSLLGLLTAGCASGAPAPADTAGDPAASVSTTDGALSPMVASFSAAQVERGRTQFGAICGECHSVSEFRGTGFQYTWRRRTAWDFYRTVSTSMPEDAPGSLSDGQYVDVIAWILGMNGFAPGAAELPATEAALDQFVMDGGPGH